MKEAVAEGTIRGIVVVPGGVEFVKTVPTEFEIALHTLHVFAASGTDDAHVAPRTGLRREDLKQIAEQGQLADIQSAQVRQREERQLRMQLGFSVPPEFAG